MQAGVRSGEEPGRVSLKQPASSAMITLETLNRR